MKIKEEKLYVFIALMIGVLFCFLVPPFQSPDEDSHFKKSYLISKGIFYPTVKNNKVGNYFPKDMVDYIAKKLKYGSNRDKKYKYSEMVLDQYSTMNYEKKVFKEYSTSTILPIVYVAPASGIIVSKAIAKVFKMESISPAYMLYFARLFSLFLTIFLIYEAIKIAPMYKKTIFTIGLMPMALFLSSMVSYDNILISLSLLSTAIILDLIYNKKTKKINKWHIFVLSIIGIILLNVKTVYSLSFLLIFFIPKEKYGSVKTKDMIKVWAIALGIIFIGTLLFKLPYTFLPRTQNALFTKQLSFILKNPLKYFNILIMNICDTRSFQLNTMVGVFGLLDTYLPISLVGLYLFYFIIFSFIEGCESSYVISLSQKVILILYMLIAIFGIYTIMYLDWTPKALNKIGGKVITGVQGRYFIPLLLPFSLLFSNKKLKKFSNLKKILNYYFVVPCGMIIVSTFMILLRFWI